MIAVSVSASSNNAYSARIVWPAPADLDNDSNVVLELPVDKYDICISGDTPPTELNEWQVYGTHFFDPFPPHLPDVMETYVLTGLSPSTSYHVTARAADPYGNWSGMSNDLYIRTGDVYPADGLVQATDILAVGRHGRFNGGQRRFRAQPFLSTGDGIIYEGSYGWRMFTVDTTRTLWQTFSGSLNGDDMTDVVLLYKTDATSPNGVGFCIEQAVWDHEGEYVDFGETMFSGDCPSIDFTVDDVVDMTGGDFTRDGYVDLAFLVDRGLQLNGKYRSEIFVTAWNPATGQFNCPVSWWAADGYEARRCVAFVAGRFDHVDGFDIAIVRDIGLQPNGKYQTRIQVFMSRGTYFAYSGGQGWWQADGYEARRSVHVLVCDYDGNDLDDIAIVRDIGLQPNGQYQTRIQTFLSTGSSFHYTGGQGWWQADGYNAATKLFGCAGYFNGDAYGDIILFSRISEEETRLQSFYSTGNSFDYSGGQGIYQMYDYPLDSVFAVMPVQCHPNGGPLPKLVVSPSSELKGDPVDTVSVGPNYPNPFNPSTTIRYSVAKTCDVNIYVYNVLGQVVTVLYDGKQEPGEYSVEWNAGSNFATGMYLCRVTVGEYHKNLKMLLIK
ncbi:MAG: T9SS type A sorting domain-containing protein [Patescibacteria group bacterium]